MRICRYFTFISMLLLLSAFLLLPSACAPERGARTSRELAAVDGGGRTVETLETGSTLYVSANRLEPFRLYEFRLSAADADPERRDQTISFSRLGANAEGVIDPFVLWYHSGVVGCSLRSPGFAGTDGGGFSGELPPYTYRSFDEAERALARQRLVVTIHEVEPDASGRRDPMSLRVGAAMRTLNLPVAPAKSPIVYPSNAKGCLTNSAETQTRDLYVSGRNFRPNEEIVLSVVANQRAWYVGDAVQDVTGTSGAAAPVRVTADANGAFTVKVWDQALQRRGVYDMIAQRGHLDPSVLNRIRAGDIVSYGQDTGLILYMLYPVGGPLMDIAGRP
ncbi:MAG TPA: hypothetical protein VD713_05720, partial [Sphingomonadales bacterium]|nr:hypothetical protein [Sphingomonadales bacterium]